jgi:hypothetical protein
VRGRRARRKTSTGPARRTSAVHIRGSRHEGAWEAATAGTDRESDENRIDAIEDVRPYETVDRDTSDAGAERPDRELTSVSVVLGERLGWTTRNSLGDGSRI